MRAGTETRAIMKMGKGTIMRTGNGNENRIGDGGGEAKKRKKSHKTCRRPMGNGRKLGEKRKRCRKERVGPVASIPENLENNKEAGGGGTRYPGLI